MFQALRSKIVLSLTLFTLVFATTFVIVYAYFQIQEQRGIMIETGDFQVEMLAYFNTTLVDVNSPYYDAQTGTLIVNADDPLSMNYVGNLSVSFNVTSIVASRMRIKLQEEWTLTRHYLDQNPLYPIPDVVESVYSSNHGALYYPFSLLKVTQSYVPIYTIDGYAYYPDVIPKGSANLISFIIGGDPYPVRNNEVFVETCALHLNVLVDIVQANRFSEVWNIDPTFFN